MALNPPRNAKEANERARLQFKRIFTALIVAEAVITAIGIAGFLVMSHYLVVSELFITAVLFLWTFLTISIFATFALRAEERETLFWKVVAEERGYAYERKPHFQNVSLVFREGRGRFAKHGLIGTVENQGFRFFQYSYVVGSGKSSRTYSYSVFEVTFSGSFPHIYLNNEHNRDLSGFKEAFLNRIGLPAAFDAKFRLYGPKGYEIEVLEVLTPDVLALLMDEGWEHDTEIVDSKLYMFCERQVRTRAELDTELKRLSAATSLLAPRLNRLKLTPIGNLSSTL